MNSLSENFSMNMMSTGIFILAATTSVKCYKRQESIWLQFQLKKCMKDWTRITLDTLSLRNSRNSSIMSSDSLGFIIIMLIKFNEHKLLISRAVQKKSKIVQRITSTRRTKAAIDEILAFCFNPMIYSFMCLFSSFPSFNFPSSYTINSYCSFILSSGVSFLLPFIINFSSPFR